MISLVITLMLMFSVGSVEVVKQTNTYNYTDTCRSIEDAEKLKNKDAIICGRLERFTPWESGKGSGHMFWQWQITFPGGGSIPVVNMNKSDGESIVFDEYSNSDVRIYGRVFYGIVIGDSDPTRQSATGFRIDADGIEFSGDYSENKNLDTCWIYADFEEHQNTEVIAAGKLIEYIPPHDDSKLGNEKIWDYELELQDGNYIPLKKAGSELEPGSFKDKDVFIHAVITYGIIFGEENTANITGYRIDPHSIKVNNNGYGDSYIEHKIRLNLGEFNDEGYRVHPDGEKSSAFYEFCIPASDSLLNEVKSIDPGAEVMKGSKGRSGCSEMEWLVIGGTRQSNFKDVLRKLAELKYIRKITETFWE